MCRLQRKKYLITVDHNIYVKVVDPWRETEQVEVSPSGALVAMVIWKSTCHNKKTHTKNAGVYIYNVDFKTQVNNDPSARP